MANGFVFFSFSFLIFDVVDASFSSFLLLDT